jgi:hypothetical protein
LVIFACQGVAAAMPDRFLTGWFMSTMLISPGEWAQNEFGFAQLGDRRRNRRLVSIAQHLAAHPGGTLPQVFPDWAELKAAYRFFGQEGSIFNRFSPRMWSAPGAAATRPESI